MAIATPARPTRISREIALRPIERPTISHSNHARLSLDSVHSVTKLDLIPQQHVDVVDGILNGSAIQLGVPHITSKMNYSSPSLNNNMCAMVPERDVGPDLKLSTPSSFKAIPHRPVSGPEKLTIKSQPVKSQPPMLSSKLSNHHKIINTKAIHSPLVQSNGSNVSGHNMELPSYQQLQNQQPINIRTHHHAEPRDFSENVRVREYQSSSDENRSSGHASMSDTGHRSSSPILQSQNDDELNALCEERFAAGVTNRNARNRASTGHPRSRHRATPAKVPWKGSGLEDIKMAIQQLTMRSQTSTSTYSSVSAGSESSEPARRLARYSSLETVNTNVTADEFVWVDSHNRLVELQHPPWNQHCIMRVIRTGRCREYAERIAPETAPRLGYLLQRALVRIAREIQRLSSEIGLCSKQEVAGAFKIILCPALSDSCIKACLRAAAMFGVPGDSALRLQSKSSRAGLQLPVGRFHRWMCDARLGRFLHEYAAVYLTAGMENLLEEILLLSLPADATIHLTATALESAIANSGDLWGLLQPYAHLNAGRISSGALTMPRWPSNNIVSNLSSATSIEPCLLTTCVGSAIELKGLVLRAQSRFNHGTLSSAALTTLFYFMRCSQLEHNEGNEMINYK